MTGPLAVDFTVPGEPVPKARPRVTRRGTYTPKRTEDYAAKIKAAWLKARPAGWQPDAAHAWAVIIQVTRATRYRADVDNYAKAVMDALNGLAWADDYQVRHLAVSVDQVALKDDASLAVSLWQNGPLP